MPPGLHELTIKLIQKRRNHDAPHDWATPKKYHNIYEACRRCHLLRHRRWMTRKNNSFFEHRYNSVSYHDDPGCFQTSEGVNE